MERSYINGFVNKVAPPLCVIVSAKVFFFQLASLLIFTLSQLGIFSLPASVKNTFKAE